MKQKKRKGKSKVWIVLLVIVGVLVVGTGIALLAFEPGRREAMNLTVSPAAFAGLQDGVYTGAYVGSKDKLRNAGVQVTVDQGAVSDIEVTGGSLAGGKQSAEIRNGQSLDDLFGRVIDSQSLQVDVISGATITCKVHLKAVENALTQAETQ